MREGTRGRAGARAVSGAALFAMLVLLAPSAALAHARAHTTGRARARTTASEPDARQIPVSFTVVNDNATAVACSADGKTYTVRGTLTLPAGPVPPGVTLYVHGLGYASYFWQFTAVPGYDYVGAEVHAGHASLVIDRLGYGTSSIPNGNDTCVGSQATILHEIVQDLRTGTYTTNSGPAPSFSPIGLVGHSAGGELVEIEAYTWHDINALGVMEWADADYSVGAYSAFGSDAVQCATGGEDQVGSTSPGYAKFGETDSEYDSLMFHDVDPAVETAANGLRTLDPCGQIESILTGVAVDLLRDGSIDVPIAYVHASQDAIFTIGTPWPQLQETLYTGSPKVTDISLPGEGHAVTLERSATTLAADMNTWLTANGL